MNIQNEANELKLLFEVAQAMEGTADFSERLDSALGIMAKYTGLKYGMLLLLDPSRKEIVAEASHGLTDWQRARARYAIGEGITGRVAQTGQAMIVPSVAVEQMFLNKIGLSDIEKEDMAFICVPVSIAGETIGALSACRPFSDSISLEEDMRLMRMLASLFARAIRVRRHAEHPYSGISEAGDKPERSTRRGKVHSGGAKVENTGHVPDGLELNLDGMVVGSSPAMLRVFEELAHVADSRATVLLTGESGTGKELVAGMIHANSGRAGRPFVKVNCAALPEGLVESELFGHERGAFTGAVSARKGRFEMAHGGTLFLDEVGDMTQLAQAKLLRALQEKEFERVGGTQTLSVDVRLIAATNHDLEGLVEGGKFRRDLYYRLCVFPINLPLLRERKEDILPLAAWFAKKYAEENCRRFSIISAQASGMLMAWSWPGNIRELENIIARAVLLCGSDGIIDTLHLPAHLRGVSEALPVVGLDEALAALEKRLIVQALEECRGNMARAAEKLDITERIMGLRVKRHALDFRDFR